MTCARLDESGPPRVAYAVGRRVGGAVARNRVRRRLRAVVRDEAAHLEPACAYLDQRRPRARSTTPFSELRATFRAIVGDLAASPGAPVVSASTEPSRPGLVPARGPEGHHPVPTRHRQPAVAVPLHPVVLPVRP